MADRQPGILSWRWWPLRPEQGITTQECASSFQHLGCHAEGVHMLAGVIRAAGNNKGFRVYKCRSYVTATYGSWMCTQGGLGLFTMHASTEIDLLPNFYQPSPAPTTYLATLHTLCQPISWFPTATMAIWHPSRSGTTKCTHRPAWMLSVQLGCWSVNGVGWNILTWSLYQTFRHSFLPRAFYTILSSSMTSLTRRRLKL